MSTSVQKVCGFWYVSCVIFGNSIFQKCIIAMWKCKGFQKIPIQIKVNVCLFKITIWVKLKVNKEDLSNSPLDHKVRSGQVFTICILYLPYVNENTNRAI